MGATTDTCADMSWVLGDECGTVVRGLCQRPVFGYGLRLASFGSGYDFVLVVFLVSVLVLVPVCCYVACCLRSFMVYCTFLLDTSSALDMRELCCWKGD